MPSFPVRLHRCCANLGHEATDVRDIGLGNATDALIAAYARSNQLTLVTRDFDFADIRNYPPADYLGIVVLQLPDDATAGRVVQLLETFIRREERMVKAIEATKGKRLTYKPRVGKSEI